MNIKNKNWFTLVELIIVITILSILSTIAFLSFSWFTHKAKDSKRLTDVTNIKKSVEIFSIKAWKYPDISSDNKALAYWKEIFKYWEIDNNLTELLGIKWLTKDSISSKNYIYGVSFNNKKFQVWGFLEDKNNFSFILKTYANNDNYISIVEWNYDWMIKFSTWWSLYITNPPSLLLNNTWSVQLFSESDLYFLINNWNNIYHNIKNIDWAWKILNDINWSWATLTWVVIDNINSDNIVNYFTEENNLLVSFWWDLEKIWTNIFWNTSSISYNNCEYNGFWFNHWENKVFYKKTESFNCLNDSIIYTCTNWVVQEDWNPISWLTEFIYDQCIDDTTCRFDFWNLFDGSCHF